MEENREVDDMQIQTEDAGADKKTDEFDWPHLTLRTHLLIIGGAALAAVITFLMIYLAVR